MTDPTQHEPEPAVLERILDAGGRRSRDVIAVLQAIQAHYHYLPEPALRYICEHSDIRPAAIAGVSTFYTQFRHTPAGRYTVKVCIGTACHVKGAGRIIEALKRHLRIPEGEDTDSGNTFTIQPVNCLGCCTLAPVVQIGDVIYGHATTDNAGGILEDFLKQAEEGGGGSEAGAVPVAGASGEIRIGLGSCCIASGAAKVESVIRERVSAMRIPARIQRVSCIGLCYQEPLIEIAAGGGPPRLYTHVHPDAVPAILRENFPPPRLRRRLLYAAEHWLETLYTGAPQEAPERFPADTRDPQIAAYLDPQVHIATENAGRLDPLNLEDYRSTGGFEALSMVLEHLRPEDVRARITESGLRGRGGAGYPTGEKWHEVSLAADRNPYLICNGDEGDPGAFMDRMLLESYPYRVIEGMLIAGYAIGATEGALYIRSEYPLAIKRIRKALDACRTAGLLGPDIFNSGFAFTLSVAEGAGAFVCGEETALIAAMEGKRGMPRTRPPYPSECGFLNRPTLVNNTETFAMVSWIIRNGPEAFAAIGTDTSKGTKVFALAGKIRRGGLVEVPMGMTIREVIEVIGGGIADGHRLKAVQIGGPSGGCIPARLADTPIDYEALVETGAMMGSGGLVALDETDCMVEIARYFLAFTQYESCGKCTFCRIGTKRMLELLEGLCEGRAKPGDIQELERLAGLVKRGSLCGLGKTAPNPPLTTLRYFRDEYEAHLHGICPAGQCKALISYTVTDACIGCTRCARGCPADAIRSIPYEKHEINPETCVRCDACRAGCPEHAIVIMSGGRITQRSADPEAPPPSVTG